MKKYSAIKDMYYGNRGVHDKFKIENEEKIGFRRYYQMWRHIA